MTGRQLHLVVPGPLEQRTGGYIYDARMVEGLRRRGWSVDVRDLGGDSPSGDPRATGALSEALARLADGALVIIDGLAMAGAPKVIRAHATRLTVLALVHMVQGDEPGLEPAGRERRLALEGQALSASAGVIVTSAFTANRLIELGVDAVRIRTVPPGISGTAGNAIDPSASVKNACDPVAWKSMLACASKVMNSPKSGSHRTG